MNQSQLESWRDTIDVIDESILLLLGQRYKICRQVGDWKKQHAISIVQPTRNDEVIKRCASIGEKLGMSQEFIKELYQLIIKEAYRTESLT